MPTAAEPLRDLSRLCVHTITTKPWPIETAAERYAAALRAPLLRIAGIFVAWKLIPLIFPGMLAAVTRGLYS